MSLHASCILDDTVTFQRTMCDMIQSLIQADLVQGHEAFVAAPRTSFTQSQDDGGASSSFQSPTFNYGG